MLGIFLHSSSVQLLSKTSRENRFKMFKLLAVLAFVPAILAQTPVRQCVGNFPLPTAVWFGSRENPCTAAPCDLSRSGGVGVTYVDFEVPFNAATIMPRVRATVFGSVTVIPELPEEIARNPCGILTGGSSCPLSAGQHASYRLALPIDPTTPLIPSDNEITLFGENNEVIFCYRLQNQLVV